MEMIITKNQAKKRRFTTKAKKKLNAKEKKNLNAKTQRSKGAKKEMEPRIYTDFHGF
jgi:hypothetical protein